MGNLVEVASGLSEEEVIKSPAAVEAPPVDAVDGEVVAAEDEEEVVSLSADGGVMLKPTKAAMRRISLAVATVKGSSEDGRGGGGGRGSEGGGAGFASEADGSDGSGISERALRSGTASSRWKAPSNRWNASISPGLVAAA